MFGIVFYGNPVTLLHGDGYGYSFTWFLSMKLGQALCPSSYGHWFEAGYQIAHNALCGYPTVKMELDIQA